MDTKARLEKLNLTDEEATQFTKAFQDEGFLNLFTEYLQEIRDPEVLAQRERELDAMEQGEYDEYLRNANVDLITPDEGVCLKTMEEGTNAKVFVNLCRSDRIARAFVDKEASSDEKGQSWKVPYTVAPLKHVKDAAGVNCMCFDAVFHPDTLARGLISEAFFDMLVSTAFDGIRQRFSVVLPQNAYKKLKNVYYKGQRTRIPVRRENKDAGSSSSNSSSSSSSNSKNSERKQADPPKPKPRVRIEEVEEKEEAVDARLPKYTILYRGGGIDMSEHMLSTREVNNRPSELVVNIELPRMQRASQADLQVTENQLVLTSEAADYQLDLKLPYEVDDEAGSAKFDKKKRVMSVTLPVRKQVQAPQPFVEPRLSPEELELQEEEARLEEEKRKRKEAERERARLVEQRLHDKRAGVHAPGEDSDDEGDDEDEEDEEETAEEATHTVGAHPLVRDADDKAAPRRAGKEAVDESEVREESGKQEEAAQEGQAGRKKKTTQPKVRAQTSRKVESAARTAELVFELD